MAKSQTIEQELVQALLQVAYLYSGATGASLSSIGRAACQNARFFDALTGGKSCTLRIYSDMMQFFSDHWPDGTQWPVNVRRPLSRAEPAPEKPTAARRKRKD